MWPGGGGLSGPKSLPSRLDIVARISVTIWRPLAAVVMAVVTGEISPHREIATGIGIATGIEITTGIEIAIGIRIAPGIGIATGIEIATGIGIATGIATCRRVEPRIIGEGVGHERNGVIPGRREGVIDGLIAARTARV